MNPRVRTLQRPAAPAGPTSGPAGAAGVGQKEGTRGERQSRRENQSEGRAEKGRGERAEGSRREGDCLPPLEHQEADNGGRQEPETDKNRGRVETGGGESTHGRRCGETYRTPCTHCATARLLPFCTAFTERPRPVHDAPLRTSPTRTAVSSASGWQALTEVQVGRPAVSSRRTVGPCEAARSTYLPTRSNSRLTDCPARHAPAVVLPHVCGMMASVNVG